MNNITLILLLAFAIALILTILVTPQIVKVAHELKLYDLPDSERKVHKLPIPRLGGVMFLPILMVTLTIMVVILIRLKMYDEIGRNMDIGHFMAFIAGGMMLYAVGMFDDIKEVPYKIKFIVQILAGVLLCVAGLWVADLSYVFFIREIPWWIGMPLTIHSVVYVTNAMNLIDGIDGLSSGLSIISLICLTFRLVITGQLFWAMLAITLMGVMCGFFYYNVFGKKDKTFMGDAGSLTLGFTLCFLLLRFWQRDPVWNSALHNIGIVAASTLIIPLFDVTRVTLSRLRDHRPSFMPDKNHIHHKLMRAGLGPHMTMVTLLLLSIAFIVLNYVVASMSQTLMVIMDIALFTLMHIIINIFIYRKERETGIKWSRIF
jgi:UDP-N-acetylmuramyl pentapeptide phosphotransferase/UDP-N-acetylglucosamine-1-phosphate transferase